MSLLRYFYSPYPGDPELRPMAAGMAINMLNGKYVEFIGILDTGADQTSLSNSLLEDLGVDPLVLPKVKVGGVEGLVRCPFSDFIRIAFLEAKSLKSYFPNGREAVPLHIVNGPFSLFGRELLLDLCKVTFDGPHKTVDIEM